MTQPCITFNKNLITSALSLVLVCGAYDAMAVTIEANVDYTLSGGSTNDNATSSADPSSVDILDSAFDATGDIFYHTFGNTAGNFGSRVSGSGTFDITGFFQYDNTYTNSSGESQDYSLDFTIIPGELFQSFSGLTPGQSLFSSYDIDVMIDTDQDGTFETMLYESFASITTTDAGSVLAQSGSVLDGASYSSDPNFAQYSWNSTTESLFIGSFLDGESFDLRYILSTTATGVGLDNNDCGEEGDFVAAPTVDFIDGPCNSALARSGDPFGPGNPNNITVASTPTNPVPEPAGLALIGLGATILFIRRNRKAR